MASRAEEWRNEISITQNNTEQFQQYFANPLLYDELNLTTRSHADTVFDKIPNWNDQSALTGVDDGEVQFQIHHPLPVKLNTIHFAIELNIKNMPAQADMFKVLPMSDFFAQLFNCITINIGSNSCNIDHLDTYADVFSYVFKRLFTDNEYQNHLGRIDGMIPDSPGYFQLQADIIPANNTGGRTRSTQLFQNGAENDYCVRGIFRPSNLFLQKAKILPPYVPLRFVLKRNPDSVFLKYTAANVAPTVNVRSFKLRYMNYNIRSGVYETFREMYDKNRMRLPDMEMPINPFENPTAIYEYFDVRASMYSIPAQTLVHLQPLRTNSNIPKAIIFCFGVATKTTRERNHFQFTTAIIKNYSILKDSQPIVPCAVVRHTNCNNPEQDFYMRTRNTLDHLLTNETNSLRYLDFAGGAGIFAENLNNANSIWVPSLQTVGQLELKIEFEAATVNPVYLYVFLVFDQKLIINEQFNAYLTTSV